MERIQIRQREERRKDEQKRKEIMQIQDRRKRHIAISKNMDLFTNKKER